MDWHNELQDSLIWLSVAFAITLSACAALLFITRQRSRLGRQFWQLSLPYFSPRRDWRPFAKVLAILLLTLFSVRMNVLFSFWYNGFYSALQALNSNQVWTLLAIFSVLASIHVVRALVDYYLQKAFAIEWRIWLNEHLLQRWLNEQTYYRNRHLETSIDNPDQRIQQDISSFIDTSINLATGLVSAVVSIFAFSIVLWGLAGPISVLGIEVPRAMVFLVYLYVLVATLVAFKIGRPLVRLSFLNEQFNANYRYALVRLGEYGESIAFYRGEAIESANLRQRFSDVIGNAWSLVFRNLKLSGFNFGIAQAAVVFPFIVQLPRYLSKQIALGDVMQTGNAFGQVHDALSFFRESYDTFAGYRAVLDRLTGFVEATDRARELPRPAPETTGEKIELSGLNIRRPDSGVLVANLSLDLSTHQPLLIRGPSGAGKTTLLRSIAGLWPYAEGKIVCPADEGTLFLAQRPYLPQGTLRQALYYPSAAQRGEEARLILQLIQLDQLTQRLDEVADWSQMLSLGEQQRLAFGRILLNRPKAVFLDEATSAMDEALEAQMYRLMQTHLPGTQFISVGHRSTLKAFHRFELALTGDGSWQVSTL